MDGERTLAWVGREIERSSEGDVERGGDRVTELTIRQARADEVDDLRRLDVDAGRRFLAVDMAYVAGDEAAPPPWYRERLAMGRLWVAQGPGSRILGYAGTSVVDGEGHLDQISVLDGWSGHGIGVGLVDAVLAWAEDRGDPAVTLTTFRDVRFNGPWYRKLGFEEVAEADLAPELAAIRAEERTRGLDRHPRIAMRRPLGRSR